ncbi:MAG TPA: serine/threonine-protein kinase, partial [Anaerolineae bacterium]
MSTLRAGLSVGPYVIEHVLKEGRGGYAQVVVARQALPGGGAEAHVALKFARTQVPGRDDEKATETARHYERALTTEVELLRDLRHPGVVRLYSIPIDRQRFRYQARAAELDGQPWYFAMEYLAGGSLQALLDQQKVLDLPLTVEIAQQIAGTLDYLHSRGISHLDLKANNVLFREPLAGHIAPQAVLIDFGTAQKLVRHAEEEGATVSYSPPERVAIMMGKAPPESFANKPAADVYSLGVLLYRMVTGRLPFTGERSHVTTRILTESPTRPVSYSRPLQTAPGLDDLIMEMLAKEPAGRPSAAAVAKRLDDILPGPRFAVAAGSGAVRKTTAPAGTGWKVATVMFFSLALVEAGVPPANWAGLARRLLAVPPTATATLTPTPRSQPQIPVPATKSVNLAPSPVPTPVSTVEPADAETAA